MATNDGETSAAWLEAGAGERWRLDSNCPIGRSPSNRIVINDRKVSRRHAVVHRQDDNEFFLVDLGSQNGSYVNGLRIALPVRLKDRDRVTLGHSNLIFRQHGLLITETAEGMPRSQTIVDVRSVRSFLVLADIVNSTRLAKECEPAEWAARVGTWTGTCSELIERHGGAINKYLGDGFLAIWPLDQRRIAHVRSGLAVLLEVQRQSILPFRLVLHAGEIMSGGGRTLGEDNLSGLELVMLFRMERLAAKKGLNFLCSAAAYRYIRQALELNYIGEYVVEDYVDEVARRFYGLKPE